MTPETHEITTERLTEIWEKCAAVNYAEGDMFLDDWILMSRKLSEVAKELGLPDMPGNGDMITDPAHRAFILGARWGFKHGMEKQEYLNQAKQIL